MKTIILALLTCVCCQSFAEFKAAALAVDLDMPEGTPIAGFGAGSRRNLNPFQDTPFAYFFKPGKKSVDSVRSKIFILQNGDKKIAWVSVDLVASTTKFSEFLSARLGHLGFNKENIFVSATHTHSGPGAFADNKFWALVAVDKFHQTIFDHIANKMAQTLEEADKNLKPAKIGISQVEINSVTENRRKNPFLDPVATVIKIDDLSNNAIGTVINFPIHGTLFGPNNLAFSSDVIGAIERETEKRTSAPTVFLNAAEGDVTPSAKGGETPAEKAQFIADIVATEVVKSRNDSVTKSDGNLNYVFKQLDLPSAKLNIKVCIEHAIKINIGAYMPRSAPFHAVQILDTAFVTVPGEVITELGLLIKKQGTDLGFSKTAVVGLTNEHLGYILTPEEYDKGGLEGCGSMYGRKLGDWTLETTRTLLVNLKK